MTHTHRKQKKIEKNPIYIYIPTHYMYIYIERNTGIFIAVSLLAVRRSCTSLGEHR